MKSPLYFSMRLAGKDVTQTDEQGNNRQMPMWERGLRVTGGVFGALQTINTEIATPNSITNRAVDKLEDIFKNLPKTQTELITPEGLKVKVSVSKTPLEKLNEPLEISISADYANEKHIRLGKQSPYGGTRAREFITDKD